MFLYVAGNDPFGQLGGVGFVFIPHDGVHDVQGHGGLVRGVVDAAGGTALRGLPRAHRERKSASNLRREPTSAGLATRPSGSSALPAGVPQGLLKIARSFNCGFRAKNNPAPPGRLKQGRLGFSRPCRTGLDWWRQPAVETTG